MLKKMLDKLFYKMLKSRERETFIHLLGDRKIIPDCVLSKRTLENDYTFQNVVFYYPEITECAFRGNLKVEGCIIERSVFANNYITPSGGGCEAT